MITVRVQVVTDLEIINIGNNPVDQVVASYISEAYCGEYQGNEYVSSYFIVWNQVKEFVKEVKALKGVNEVSVIPSLDVSNTKSNLQKVQEVKNKLDGNRDTVVTIRLVDEGLLITDLESNEELLIDI